mmetsp:Transcript_33246/g.91620  ORF Transcript_33246/g.91620 Transcript_33246/m.91620 type:complete len:235 (-) Transcript_33246:9-713(-)
MPSTMQMLTLPVRPCSSTYISMAFLTSSAVARSLPYIPSSSVFAPAVSPIRLMISFAVENKSKEMLLFCVKIFATTSSGNAYLKVGATLQPLAKNASRSSSRLIGFVSFNKDARGTKERPPKDFERREGREMGEQQRQSPLSETDWPRRVGELPALAAAAFGWAPFPRKSVKDCALANFFDEDSFWRILEEDALAASAGCEFEVRGWEEFRSSAPSGDGGTGQPLEADRLWMGT